MERDIFPASAEAVERKVVQKLPDLQLKELLIAFKDVLSRAEMLAHHHIQAEALSVRQRMSEVLERIRRTEFIEFSQLFDPAEGRMGVTVTFLSLLELLKESLIELVQAEPYAPIHVRAAGNVKAVPDSGIEALEDESQGESDDAFIDDESLTEEPQHLTERSLAAVDLNKQDPTD
jgi:segregation and condensation protein A